MWTWLRRLRARIRYRHFDRDLQDELATHASLTRERLASDGVSNDEARRRAARQLGNVTLAREDARAVWVAPWLESLWQDVRYSIRTLRRTPAFTLTALLILSVGIGLNTSLFGLVNGLLLRTWPVPDAHEVVAVYGAGASSPSTASTSAVEYRFLRDNADTVDLVAMRGIFVRLDGEPDSPRLDAQTVSGNYFDVLRMPIVLGRGFHADEDVPGAAVNAAVIGHALWNQLAGRSPDVVGRTIHLNGLPFTVIGVAAAGATDSTTDVPDLWLPLATTPSLSPDGPFGQGFLLDPQYCCVRLAGRLRDGATREAAEVELSGLDRQFREPRGTERRGMIVTSTAAGSQPGSDQIVPIAALIFAGLLLLLLVATANLGNLLLALGHDAPRRAHDPVRAWSQPFPGGAAVADGERRPRRGRHGRVGWRCFRAAAPGAQRTRPVSGGRQPGRSSDPVRRRGRGPGLGGFEPGAGMGGARVGWSSARGRRPAARSGCGRAFSLRRWR